MDAGSGGGPESLNGGGDGAIGGVARPAGEATDSGGGATGSGEGVAASVKRPAGEATDSDADTTGGIERQTSAAPDSGAGAEDKVERLADGKLLLDRPAPAVARLRIANPARGNALDHEILAAIAATLPRLDDGIATRCVLFTGTPPLFSAGYDIAEFTEEAFEREAEALVAHPFQEAMEAIVAHPWPTVAAINGHSLGGGLELAVSCDLRVAAAGAKLGMPPAKLGLIYSHTGLRRFIGTIGAPRTRQLFFTGRNLTAERAERIGLVNEVVADEEIDDAGLVLAAGIAAAAPLSVRGNKRVIDTLAANPTLSPAQEEELVELRRSCFGSADFREGVRAFAEKRPPVWTGE